MICPICKNLMTKRRYGFILQHFCGLCFHSVTEKIHPSQDFIKVEIFEGDSE